MRLTGRKEEKGGSCLCERSFFSFLFFSLFFVLCFHAQAEAKAGQVIHNNNNNSSPGGEE